MTLYARKIVLRNCGRFTVIQSDFGADYRTHTHATSEALYASLTRGTTWQPRTIVVNDDVDDFVRDYNPSVLPIWFTPGVFLGESGESQLPHASFDATYFNVLHEVYPSTSKSYGFDKMGTLKLQSRPHHTPTYGTWQGIKPDHRLATYAFSPDYALIQGFAYGQTYLLGKKRTMMQISETGEIMRGETQTGSCLTPYLQVSTRGVALFQSFEVLAGTMRYLIMRGITQEGARFVQFNNDLAIPEFAIPSYMKDAQG